MPTVTRFFIRTGLIWFVLALGAALLTELRWLNIPAMRPLYWHMLMVGWITQIIMGVSLWMFPGRSRSDAFKDHLKGWLTFGLLNAGLVLRFISEPVAGPGGSFIWAVLLIVSALLQWLAGAIYILELWPRVQSRKQRLKKRREQ